MRQGVNLSRFTRTARASALFLTLGGAGRSFTHAPLAIGVGMRSLVIAALVVSAVLFGVGAIVVRLGCLGTITRRKHAHKREEQAQNTQQLLHFLPPKVKKCDSEAVAQKTHSSNCRQTKSFIVSKHAKEEHAHFYQKMCVL
jgi:predicted DNA repair protein MutK